MPHQGPAGQTPLQGSCASSYLVLPTRDHESALLVLGWVARTWGVPVNYDKAVGVL